MSDEAKSPSVGGQPPRGPQERGPQEFEKVLANSDKKVAEFDHSHKSAMDRLQHFLHTNPTTIPVFVLALTIVAFGLLAPKTFLTPFNLSLIIQQVAIIGILGIAQTLVIMTAGIDLSVGAIMVLASVVMGKLSVEQGVPVPLALLAGITLGTLCGLLNGFLVAKIKLPPFIVTLGTWKVFYSLNIWYSNSESIRGSDIEAIAPFLTYLGGIFNIWGAAITYGIIFMIVLFVLFWYVLSHTAYGRHVYAVGDDPDAANLAGIRSENVLLSVYALSGLICGLAAFALIGRIDAVSPQSGQSANLECITAVVIGGTSLFGGRGSLLGTLAGALIVGAMSSGLSQVGADPLWKEFSEGVLIIIAVGIDQWIRRVSA